MIAWVFVVVAWSAGLALALSTGDGWWIGVSTIVATVGGVLLFAIFN